MTEPMFVFIVAAFFVGIFFLLRNISKDKIRRKGKKVSSVYRVNRTFRRKGDYSNDHSYLSDLIDNSQIHDTPNLSGHNSGHDYHDFLNNSSDISHGVDSLDINHH
jgi:hypothetical protein